MPKRIEPEAFWDRVERKGPEECWPWIGSRRIQDGRGLFNLYGRQETSNRAALMLSGQMPAKGQIAMHSCDNPPCCNPAHLRWGTYSENTRDAVSRGRQRYPGSKGEDHPHAKLTLTQVKAIRKAYPKESQSSLARRYGVSQVAIFYIVHNINWRA